MRVTRSHFLGWGINPRIPVQLPRNLSFCHSVRSFSVARYPTPGSNCSLNAVQKFVTGCRALDFSPDVEVANTGLLVELDIGKA